jgi:myo-inositol 2-dehydrogenase/D-chiro-inositol 1-dehydrogenase
MRIGLLGVGRLGASHAETLRSLPQVERLVIYDADRARAVDVATHVGAEAVDSIDAAFRGVDTVVIVTPTDTHAALIKKAVDAKLAVFCEKPVAIGLGETKDLVSYVARARGRVQIGFQRRFDAGYNAARGELRGGTLGSVYSFYMTSRDRLPPPDAYIKTSGGQFKDQAIHDFDITRWLFDDEVDEVIAMGSTLGHPTYDGMGDVATSAVTLRLRGGALGAILAARHNEAGYDIRVEINCAKDTIAIGLDTRTPLRSVERDAPRLAGPAYPSFFVRFGQAYREELAYFLRFARGEAENACTVEDGLEALRIAEAAGLSWREHRPVPLRDIA